MGDGLGVAERLAAKARSAVTWRSVSEAGNAVVRSQTLRPRRRQLRVVAAARGCRRP
jgi:hypothetical protein